MLQIFSRYKFWIILLIIFVLLRLPSLFEPYWYGDEGIYLTLGQGIRKGLVLYNQIHDNKPPTLYYLAAISHTVFGFRLLLLAVMIPTLGLFYLLANKFLSLKLSKISLLFFLILTSIPLLEGNIANAEVFMLLPTIAGVVIFLKAKKPIHYFLSSLLLGIAFTIKVPVIFEFLFLVAYFLIQEIGNKTPLKSILINLIYFGVGFILPIFLWGSYFYFNSAFINFFKAALLQNFGYLSSWSTGNHQTSFLQGGLFLRGIVLLISWVVIFLLTSKKIINKKLSFVLFWFFTTIFASLLSGRPYPHYLIQVLPPLCLLSALVFKSQKLLLRSIVIGSVLFLGFIIISYKFYFYRTIPYYKNFYFSPNINYFGSDISDVYKVARYIQNNSTPDQKIFIWSDDAYIYPLSERLPATKYIAAYHIVDFNAYDLTISQIKAYTPKFVIYSSNNQRSFPQLNNIVRNYYFVAGSFGPFVVYQLRI